jgi:hypothetical protein
MSAEAITSYVAIAMSVGTAVIGIVNHKRVRSVCCNRRLEVSLDIEATTPPNKLELKLPVAGEIAEVVNSAQGR